jgi:hypothetical protein
MRDDPTALTFEQRNALVTFANRHAAALQFNDWIEAYHYF